MIVDCLILGDSIAVGVGQARPGCTTVARTGITSSAFVQNMLPLAPAAARRVVISLGVNDAAAMDTVDTLRLLRRGVQAGQVTWLLPGPKAAVREAIRTVAAEHGDRLVDTAGDVGPDHLHPTGSGYRRLAAVTEAAPEGAAPPPERLAGRAERPQVIYLTPPSGSGVYTRGRAVAMTWLPPVQHPAPAAY